MKALLSQLPETVKAPLKRIVALPYYGKGRDCPACGKSSRRFREYGIVPRKDAQCAHCGALERHRLLYLFLQTRADLFSGRQNMLHVAPEASLEKTFKHRIGDGYLTADLYNSNVMVQMDICDINYPDNAFDIIYCSHVLEHVEDDIKAIKEFYRVLAVGGWAILNVPITSAKTFEDPSVVDPKERLRLFGRENHVRQYGPDYIERLRGAGFSVEIITASNLASEDQIIKMGLTPASGEIYFCTKP